VTEAFELVIGGMSCAACAARIEKKLGKLDGVSATVNYATERAYVAASGGRSPEELIGVIERVGYTAALPPSPGDADLDTGREAAARALLLRLTVCLPLALVVIVLAMVPRAQFAGWQWVSLALAVPVAGWGAWPLHRGAWLSLRQAAATMDTLVSLGILASCGWSLYALIWGGAGHIGMRMPFTVGFASADSASLYWDAAAGVTAAVLAGRWLEARAKARAGSALTALDALAAGEVARLRDGVETVVPIDALAVGDVFVVRPGERVASDGVVVEGASAVDVSMLTGESVPVEVAAGDEVVGGSVNEGGRLAVRATRVGADTRLAALTRLVAEALGGKAAVQQVADRLAGMFVPCVIAVAAAVFGFWLGAGLGVSAAAGAAVAVLVVACPCALGLATPTALLVGIGRGAQSGIVIKGAQVLEAARRVDTVVFDKTGTLTTGVMSLMETVCAEGESADAVLGLGAAVEQGSEHPVGRAIAKAGAQAGAERAEGDGLEANRLEPVTEFAALPGAGVRGVVDGRRVLVGRRGLFRQEGIEVPEELEHAIERAEEQGRTGVLVGWEGRARGVFVVADQVKPDAPAAVTRMRRLGLRPILLTGDNERAAHTVAARLGIPAQDVLAEVTPEGKVEAVARLQAAGAVVAVVGDGVNDAAALARADLGMAMGTGTDVAIAAGDVTLASGDPWAAADAILLARATMRVIRTNLAWAFGYNLVALPAAALGYLNPVFAGAAMALSSVLVVTNSLRLRSFRRSAPVLARPAAALSAELPTPRPTQAPAARRRPSRLG
jgi:Cu+-exporting ATPase